jgi:pyruvate,water dikinase
LYGFRRHYQNQGVVRAAGERLWLDLTTLATNTVGRRVMRGAFTVIEPSIGKIWEGLQDDSRLQPTRRGIRPATMWRLLRLGSLAGWRAIGALLRPDARRRYIQTMADEAVAAFQDRAHFSGEPAAQLQGWLDWLHLFLRQLPRYMLAFVSTVIAGMASIFRLQALVEGASEQPELKPVYRSQALRLTRGLPHNVTTEMDLMLWETARLLASDPISAETFTQITPAELASRYLQRSLPPAAQQALENFLNRYGMRGVGEIDVGRPRWREDPTPVMQALTSYLRIDDPALAPDVIFQGSAASAQQALAEMETALRQAPGGSFKVRLLRFLARRVRALAGLRESPKFFIVRILGIARQTLLSIGAEFVKAGELDRPDDLFFLGLDELSALAAKQLDHPRRHVSVHRLAYQRELLRRRVPRLLLSDGRAFYEGLGAPGNSDAQDDGRRITGSPVSPGTAEGLVRVVLSPNGAHLDPGEILVCPGTDPSWTPLFLAAGGLVMEVGGMMTHGAVVAREYGIPAIVGVDQAVTRLKTGQHIRMDGGSGVIEVLDSKE